jgi:O-antigen/teichoic acid export membrane protein
MSIVRSQFQNAVWNWAGMLVNTLIGFAIAPFLIHRLGDTTYGLWLAIASLTGYFGFLDFGVSGSVGRNVALFRSRGDIVGLNSTVSTAFIYLCGAAALSVLMTLSMMYIFFMLIDISPAQLGAARWAIAIVGLNFALMLPLQTFDGVLWAYQRFDLQNAVDIPVGMIRAGLTFWMVGSGGDLLALAFITLATTLVGVGIKTMLAVHVEPKLCIRFSYINRQSANVVFSYGIWYFLFSTIKTTAPSIMLMIIGNSMGPSKITPFSVATRLLDYANGFLIAGTGVLTPVATDMHARDKLQHQRELLLKGGCACLLLAGLLASTLVIFGRPFIRLWVGPSLEHAYSLLLVLTAGELLYMSQHVTYSVILANGRLQILAWCSLVELVASTSVALLVAPSYGLFGICVAAALSKAVCRGICPALYACHAIGVRVVDYIVRAVLPAIAIAAGPMLLFGLVRNIWTPNDWLELLIAAGAYAALYTVVASVGLFWARLRSFATRRKRWRNHEPSLPGGFTARHGNEAIR